MFELDTFELDTFEPCVRVGYVRVWIRSSRVFEPCVRVGYVRVGYVRVQPLCKQRQVDSFDIWIRILIRIRICIQPLCKQRQVDIQPLCKQRQVEWCQPKRRSKDTPLSPTVDQYTTSSMGYKGGVNGAWNWKKFSRAFFLFFYFPKYISIVTPLAPFTPFIYNIRIS